MKRGLGLGDVIAGRFRLMGDIGQGGMGRVFEAVDLKHDRPAAVKVVYRQLARDPEFRMRFEREAEAAERANHPHVLPVWAFGADEGHLFLATPLCDTDVAAMVDEEGPLDVETALAIVSQIAWALDWAHRRNVVHRDVKPENILIVTGPTQPHAYLADFGMAKVATTVTLTQLGTPAGLSPAYAAPEQWRGERATPATDQYALAGALYCCLTGHPPFWPMRRTEELREAHISDEPPRLGSSRDPRLEAASPALLRGLQKDPDKRYTTCGELCTAVHEAVAPAAAQGRETVLEDRLAVSAPTQPEHPTSTPRWRPAEPETEPEVPRVPAEANAGVTGPPAAVAPEVVEAEPALAESAPSGPEPTPSEPEPALSEPEPTPSEPEPAPAEEPPARHRSRRVPALVAAVVAAAGIAVALALVLGGGGGGGGDSAGKVLSPVDIGTPAVDAVAIDGSVWFAAREAGTLRRVDAASAKPVGKPVPVFAGPFRLAGVGSGLWTISSSVPQAARIDTAASAPAGTVDLPTAADDVATGEGAVWIIVNPAGPRAGGQLIAVDPESSRLRDRRPSASALAGVTAGHGAVWELEVTGAVLRRLNPSDLSTVAAIPLGIPVSLGSAAVIAGGRAVWVADGPSGQLLRVDPRSNDVATRIAIRPTNNVGLAAGGGAIWWIDQDRGTATRIDADSTRLIGSPLNLGGSAGGATVSGRTLWVSMPSERSVARVGF
jgi:serine/threonine protein kinase